MCEVQPAGAAEPGCSRIAVDDDTWATFRALALQHQITVAAAAVGLLVVGDMVPGNQPRDAGAASSP